MVGEVNTLEKINSRLILVPKILYVAISSFFYAFHANKSKFIGETFKLSKSSIGLWYTLPQTFSFIFGIKMGEIVDRLGIQKFVMSTAVMLGTIIFVIILNIKTSFYLFISLFTLYFSLASITLPLVDKITLDYLSKTPNVSKENYGTQRLFVPITYTIMSFYIEHIIPKDGKNNNDYSNLPYFGVAVGLLALLAILVFVPNLPRSASSSRGTSSTGSSFYLLISNYEYSFLLLIILLTGIVRAVLTNFLSVFWDSGLNFKMPYVDSPADHWTMKPVLKNKLAVLALAGNIMEIFVFFIRPSIINTIGLLMPLILANFLQFIRVCGYAFVSKENSHAFHIVFLLELLKGASYGLTQCSAVALVNSMCPTDLRSTSQLVYNGVFVSLSTAVSGLVFYSALLDPNIAAYKMMFIISAIIMIVSVIIMIIKYGFIDGLLFDSKKLEEKIKVIQKRENERYAFMFSVETEMKSNVEIK